MIGARVRVGRWAAGRRAFLTAALDRLRDHYADRRYTASDPIEFLYRYPRVQDREIAGLLASGLAYGNVTYIRASVARVLAALGPAPAACVRDAERQDLARLLRGFRHRWTTADEVVELLSVLRTILREGGTVERHFATGLCAGAQTVWPALETWGDDLARRGWRRGNSLLPWTRGPGACKRLHLFLRWMVRCDAIDPGGWKAVRPAQLLVPLDVHMHRMARALGLTRRRAADRAAVEEITAGFRVLRPDDPVRYDFALTRLPLHDRWSAADLQRLLRDIRAGDARFFRAVS